MRSSPLGPKPWPWLWTISRAMKEMPQPRFSVYQLRRPLKRVSPDQAANSIITDNKLEHDPEYLVDNAEPTRNVDAVLEKNFRPNRVIRNALLDWDEHCDMVALQSNTLWRTECDEFEELVKLGPPVIPQLMLKYKAQDGLTFAYELLHAILWGRTTGLQTISMADQYNMWHGWFRKGNYTEAPYFTHPPQRDDDEEARVDHGPARKVQRQMM